MRILSAGDVARAVTMGQAIAAMRDAFTQLVDGRAIVPQRLAIDTGEGIVLSMPGFLPDQKSLAIKVVTVFPKNSEARLPAVYGTIVVLDARSGAPQAVIEGGSITAMRTGAATAVATDYMARSNAKVAAIIGAGVNARGQLEGIRAVRPIDEVRIFSRSAQSAKRFAAEVAGSVDVRVCADAPSAVRGADIIVTATTSSTPVIHNADIDDGAHVNAIGAYTTAMREVDSDLVARARLVVDTRVGAMAEAGDVVIPMTEGRIGAAHIIAELGELATAAVKGRTNAQQVTLFKSVGNAAQDVALARVALDNAARLGLGTIANL